MQILLGIPNVLRLKKAILLLGTNQEATKIEKIRAERWNV
jgi:hypothetical protein